MLGRLITGLLLKAVLSLGVLIAVASYAQHLAGGDPGALWRGVADRTVGALARSAEDVGDRVGGSLEAIGGVTGGGGESVRLWTWRDANGVAHYASVPPPGVDARPLSIDPDVNVIAASRPSPPPPAESGTGASNDATALPSMAGALARARGGAPAPDADEAERVLRALGSASGR